MTIIKSKNDKCEYKYITLTNGLGVLLINDPETTISSASMAVNVGYYNDPDDYNGLAHFLEHMIFMGTQKYPKNNYFMDFINKNGGSTNAFTTTEFTNYHFDITNNAFSDALDIFGHFFIDPLFKKKSVNKEINAVDSEHCKNINDDVWRLGRIMNLIIDKKHPNSKFGTGNIKTLMKPDNNLIHNALLKFYNDNYSANLMKLVLYSNLSITKLITICEDIFSLIKNNNTPKMNYTIQQFDFINNINTNNICYKLIKFIPVSDEHILQIIWQLPNLKKYDDCKPLEYLSYFLSHQAEGSVAYNLNKLGWVVDIGSNSPSQDDTTTLFCVTAILTETGFKYVPVIINIIYDYIENVLTSGVKKWVYEEQQQIDKINFDFYIKTNPMDHITNLAMSIFYYPIKYILYGPYYYKKFDDSVVDIINMCLTHIKRSESIVIISSKKYKDKTTKYDSIYKLKYSEMINPKDYGDEFESIKPNINLMSPIKNVFIPKNLDILPKKYDNKYPISLNIENDKNDKNDKKDKNNFELWYKQDTKFKVPWILMDLFIYNPNISSSLRNDVITSLFIRYFNKKTVSMAYYTYMARSSFSIGASDEYLRVNIKSYSDNIYTIINYVISTFFSFIIEKSEFDIILDNFKTDVSNMIYSSQYKLSNEYMKEKILDKYYTFTDILSVIDTIKYEELQQVQTWFKNNSLIRCLIQGNLYKDTASELFSKFKPFYKNNNKIKRELINKLDTMDFGSEELYLRQCYNPNEVDSLIYVFFEIDSIRTNVTNNWDKKIAFLSIIHEILSERFFNQLRTKQQVGYIVRSNIKVYGNVEHLLWGYSFLILSSKFNPMDLRLRIKNFVVDAGKYIKSVDNQNILFKEYKTSVINKLLIPYNNIYEEYTNNLIEIMSADNMFNRNELLAKTVENLTLQEIITMFDEYFLNRRTRRIRTVEFYNKHELKKIDN
jgi:insulysin